MKNHHWSGWPGAYCLDCGCEDAIEIAVGCGYYDPHLSQWNDTKEAKQLKEQSEKSCPVDYNENCGQCNSRNKQ